MEFWKQTELKHIQSILSKNRHKMQSSIWTEWVWCHSVDCLNSSTWVCTYSASFYTQQNHTRPFNIIKGQVSFLSQSLLWQWLNPQKQSDLDKEVQKKRLYKGIDQGHLRISRTLYLPSHFNAAIMMPNFNRGNIQYLKRSAQETGECCFYLLFYFAI